MAAWGYIRFYCRRCGDGFWCRIADNPHALKLCHECEAARVPLASEPENVQTTGHHP